MVYGICRAMLRDGHEAEDAAQQTFLSRIVRSSAAPHVRNEAAWLATIARNECRTRIAASMRTPLPISDEDLDGDSALGRRELERQRAARGDPGGARRASRAAARSRRPARSLRPALRGGRDGARPLPSGDRGAPFRGRRRTMRRRLQADRRHGARRPVAVQEGLAQAIPGSQPPAPAAAAAGVVGRRPASRSSPPARSASRSRRPRSRSPRSGRSAPSSRSAQAGTVRSARGIDPSWTLELR